MHHRLAVFCLFLIMLFFAELKSNFSKNTPIITVQNNTETTCKISLGILESDGTLLKGTEYSLTQEKKIKFFASSSIKGRFLIFINNCPLYNIHHHSLIKITRCTENSLYTSST